MKAGITAALAVAVLIVATAGVYAGEAPSGVAASKPLWEIGIAAGGFYTPDYPAADKNSPHGLAMPYVIYRGDFLKVGKDSILKGVFIDTERLEFDVSAAASFNSSSGDNSARRGMPDLDYMFELGPQLKIKLGEFQNGKMELQLPFRSVFSTDFGRIDHRGYHFNPGISYKRAGIFGSAVDMDTSLSLSVATKKLHEYFYTVEPKFTTAVRPAYEANGGYLGSRFVLGFSYGITERLRSYFGGGLGYYGGSTNEKSPLFRQDINGSVHLVLTWMLFKSDTKVNPDR